ncbi:MAG: nitroreductase family protein [Longimicrobiales bacterium]|nr:nitroreductase family protein [Longimicrobiales bacterium]
MSRSTVEPTQEAHPPDKDEVRKRKRAPTDVPLDESIRERWSPRSFSDRPVTGEELRTLLEAARWAPSSYNEQPWRFIVALKDDRERFERLLGCLDEGNREWARNAPVLMLTVAKRVFERNGRENRHAFHDVGLAMGNLLNQATEMGLYVHQMAGIDPEGAREAFDVPERFEVVAGVALGHLGDPEQLDDPGRRKSEVSERSRKPLGDLVFEGTWGETASFVDPELPDVPHEESP